MRLVGQARGERGSVNAGNADVVGYQLRISGVVT